MQRIRTHFQQVYIIHYMDDILLAQKNDGILLASYARLQKDLVHAGLIIAHKEVQSETPFQYIGHVFYPKEIKSQELEIRKDQLKTA